MLEKQLEFNRERNPLVQVVWTKVSANLIARSAAIISQLLPSKFLRLLVLVQAAIY